MSNNDGVLSISDEGYEKMMDAQIKEAEVKNAGRQADQYQAAKAKKDKIVSDDGIHASFTTRVYKTAGHQNGIDAANNFSGPEAEVVEHQLTDEMALKIADNMKYDAEGD